MDAPDQKALPWSNQAVSYRVEGLFGTGSAPYMGMRFRAMLPQKCHLGVFWFGSR